MHWQTSCRDALVRKIVIRHPSLLARAPLPMRRIEEHPHPWDDPQANGRKNPLIDHLNQQTCRMRNISPLHPQIYLLEPL
jgi:hypothetical protein